MIHLTCVAGGHLAHFETERSRAHACSRRSRVFVRANSSRTQLASGNSSRQLLARTSPGNPSPISQLLTSARAFKIRIT